MSLTTHENGDNSNY